MAKPKLNAKETAQMNALRDAVKARMAQGMGAAKALRAALDAEIAKAEDELSLIHI